MKQKKLTGFGEFFILYIQYDYPQSCQLPKFLCSPGQKTEAAEMLVLRNYYYALVTSGRKADIHHIRNQ
jgi:hypothetical protein